MRLLKRVDLRFSEYLRGSVPHLFPPSIRQIRLSNSFAMIMSNSRQLIVLTTVSLTAAQIISIMSWNCISTMDICNHFCYAINCARATRFVTFDPVRANAPARRKAAGCSRKPCYKSKTPYAAFGNSCDEFPFASTEEGGSGAFLRCVEIEQNNG